MTITALITRPDPAGILLADQLRTRWGCGVQMVLSPVMTMEWHDDLPDLGDVQTLVFTSQNGVEAFGRLSDRRDIPCAVVGQATADKAVADGFTVILVAEDAASLMALLRQDMPPDPVLHIRGAHVASDLAQQLVQAGLKTREAILYTQRDQPLTAQAQACLSGGTPVILPLYSPRSAKILFSQGNITAPLLVAALSANVARNVPNDVVNSVLVADRPNAAALLHRLDQLYEEAKRLEGANRAQ